MASAVGTLWVLTLTPLLFFFQRITAVVVVVIASLALLFAGTVLFSS